MQQNLARDGWTEKEFEAFAAQQVAWGLWSEDVSAAAQQAMTDANNITAAIERIPSEKTFTFTTFTVGASEVASLTGANNVPGYASGTDGWQQVPSGFPNDSYPIGLTSGESFNVVPAGQSSQSGGNSNAPVMIDDASLDKLAMRIETAMQRVVN